MGRRGADGVRTCAVAAARTVRRDTAGGQSTRHRAREHRVPGRRTARQRLVLANPVPGQFDSHRRRTVRAVAVERVAGVRDGQGRGQGRSQSVPHRHPRRLAKHPADHRVACRRVVRLLPHRHLPAVLHRQARPGGSHHCAHRRGDRQRHRGRHDPVCRPPHRPRRPPTRVPRRVLCWPSHSASRCT